MMLLPQDLSVGAAEQGHSRKLTWDDAAHILISAACPEQGTYPGLLE